ncbi:phage tail tip fiber protein [Endozoicomonas acroporae]|uniref:phage tail tip fiber protein n=1 Tax=Endozoicomonas acroporae TaxID=1701104 RepID=UPI000C777398|nr:DUF1983 domain-containing protein [Endozoicomonas acroporae]
MPKLPALPASVDRYVREFLNKLVGRSGKAGDRVAMISDFTDLGLAKEKGQRLSMPASAVGSVTEILEPVNGVELPDNPVNAAGLSAAGVFGAVILQWEAPAYKGHNHTEVWRAQVDDRAQASLIHEANGSRYTDVTGNTVPYYYWIRHINSRGQVGGYNSLYGVLSAGTAGTDHIRSQVQGIIDDSYFTPDWAAHTNDQEALLTSAHGRIDSETASRVKDVASLNNGLATEIADRIAAVQSEQTARANQDSVLSGRIDTVVADLSTEEEARIAAVKTEQTARVNADSSLGLRIDQVETDLSSETTTRQAAITHVQQAIINGDKVNATDIANLTASVDQNTASITTQQTVTDGLKAEYTVKVRQESNGQITVAGIGVASGQADDGETFSQIAFAAENFFFNTPGGNAQPFVIVNAGTDASPDYKMVLDAEVQIIGAVSISQLESGELQNGTALTVGQGSIELSTASDGYGQIVITGAGGIASNDYLVLKQGRIESFVYSQSEGHIRYKEVRRTESGIASNGQQVTIPAYFKSQPTVNLYPRDISVYNASYPNQSQRLEMDHTTVQPHPTIDGAWVFTPYARLLLSDGSTTEAHGLSYLGSNTSQRWEMTGITGLKNITVHGRAASSRHSGSGNTWQNRQATMTLEYRTGSGSWIGAGSTAVNINQFNTHALQLSKSLTQGTYDIAVTLSATDRSGTFASGALEYDYQQASKSGSSWTETLYTPRGKYSSAKTLTRNISIDSYALSGWEVTRIDYRATVAFTIKARTGYDGSWITNNKIPGEAYIEVPDGNGSVTKYRVYSGTSEGGYYNEDVWKYEDSRVVNVSWSDTGYKDGNMRGPVKLYTSRTASTYKSFGENGTAIATGYASATISNITATVYYRKARTQSSAASNTFYWDSSRYDLGATDISISDAIVHWTATGE